MQWYFVAQHPLARNDNSMKTSLNKKTRAILKNKAEKLEKPIVTT